ncbi:phosphofructokinase [Pacificimonas flava]|uniref:Phosphofructokinase n=2 Tax=Pacificimonas TaxID=1960290 RepID=A0A219B635_9SPHN|nr:MULTISPECIES: ATP-dependent 6-phosphofructokinase [Pacificimonas]MBZ6378919.1 ATP-dependent 6-phosphofructokinase [Pacificimonas aurantium]OWV33830.1 phosphofructokinase [Pacificimonas flava]
MHIGILTGGGDVPGLNPCIRSVVLNADDRGWRVTGFRRGWAGVLDIDPSDSGSISDNTVALNRHNVRGLDRIGGTVLHTSRLDPRTGPSDRTDQVLSILQALGIDALITLGGDGTLRFSTHIAKKGFPVVGIPKTMDNDVPGSDFCIGFSTAISRSVEAINALRTTAESHERIAVVELFGRESGETALLAGFLAQVDRTLIAEVPVDTDRLMPLLSVDKSDHAGRYAMLVVSEGARLLGEAAPDVSGSATNRADQGVGFRLARLIEERTSERTIVQQLAYLMRAGEPDALDRMVGFAFGALAVQLVERKEFGRLVALKDGNYCHEPLEVIETGPRHVDVKRLYDENRFRAKLSAVEGMPMFLY